MGLVAVHEVCRSTHISVQNPRVELDSIVTELQVIRLGHDLAIAARPSVTEDLCDKFLANPSARPTTYFPEAYEHPLVEPQLMHL